MRTMQLSVLMLLLTLTLCLPYISAQDYTQWHLPEGARARLGKGHIGEIKYSPDGNRLAVASSIGIWIYDAHSLVELDLFTGHTDSITSIAFSPDGSTLASSSYDETVRLWDATTGRLKSVLTGHVDFIYSIAFSPDGSLLAGGGLDDSVHLWDPVNGEHTAALSGHTHTVNTVAFSPDGKTLASGAWDNTVRLWDIATGKQKSTFMGHPFFGAYASGISQVAFSPDGQTLVSAAFNLLPHISDGRGQMMRMSTPMALSTSRISFWSLGHSKREMTRHRHIEGDKNENAATFDLNATYGFRAISTNYFCPRLHRMALT